MTGFKNIKKEHIFYKGGGALPFAKMTITGKQS